MKTRRALLGSALTATVAAGLSAAVPATAVPVAVAPELTGPYRLFCPGTLLGDLVFSVRAEAHLNPPAPAAGAQFRVSGLQLVVTFVAGLDQGLHTLAPVSGSATEHLLLSGATPAAVATNAYPFSVPTPSVVPAAGVQLKVPGTPATVGPFTATTRSIVVREASTQTLFIAAGATKALKLTLNCTAFPAGTGDLDPKAPWTALKQPPAALAIRPVIAFAPAGPALPKYGPA